MGKIEIDTRITVDNAITGIKKINSALGKTAKAAGKTALSIAKLNGKMLKMIAGSALNGFSKLASTALKALPKIAGAISLFLVKALHDGLQNLAKFNDGMNPFNEAVTMMRSSLLTLKNSIGAAFAPLIQAAAPAISTVINLLAEATNKVGMFFAALTGAKTFTKAISYTDDYAKSLKKAGGAAKQAKTYLSGLDEVRTFQDESSGGGGGGASLNPNEMFETVEIESKIAMLAEKVRSFVDGAKATLAELWASFKNSEFVQDFMARFETLKVAFTNMKNKLVEVWSGFVSGLGDRSGKIQNILNAVGRFFTFFAIQIQAIIQLIIGAFAPLVKGITDAVLHIIDALDGVIEFVAGVFTGNWERAWKGIKDIVAGIANAILDIYEGIVNGLIGALNAISIDVPDWMPFGLGGKHIGFGDKLVELHLPRLASGTVVPRSSGEFAAILGDNNRETEVVSPLSTMKQAFLEALAESKQGVGTYNFSASINRRVLFEEMIEEAKLRQTINGNNPFNLA
ncbi:MAG: hypothetical protein KBT34_09915 [Prevotella sp.]|nr:hypothetical protein [Candidatus Prevotella equi]